jgi:hypothetical protein
VHDLYGIERQRFGANRVPQAGCATGASIAARSGG